MGRRSGESRWLRHAQAEASRKLNRQCDEIRHQRLVHIMIYLFQCLNRLKEKRYQQKHEQENVGRRGPIIHQFPPACRVRVSRTAQDTVNQEDTQNHP